MRSTTERPAQAIAGSGLLVHCGGPAACGSMTAQTQQSCHQGPFRSETVENGCRRTCRIGSDIRDRLMRHGKRRNPVGSGFVAELRSYATTGIAHCGRSRLDDTRRKRSFRSRSSTKDASLLHIAKTALARPGLAVRIAQFYSGKILVIRQTHIDAQLTVPKPRDGA
jgi:hypothetical protein